MARPARNPASATMAASPHALLLLLLSLQAHRCGAFAVPSSFAGTSTTASWSSSSSFALFASEGDKAGLGGGTLFFADAVEEEKKEEAVAAASSASSPTATTPPRRPSQLFDESTLAEANDALAGVGWAGVAPMQGEGEMTSDDPFVKRIDESVRDEMGVGLDGLLNPAKVVNLERDLYNLRTELAGLTGAAAAGGADGTMATESCDAGGGGAEADAIRAKISKKERDLATERRAVFRGWLKDVFLGQALLSAVLSYVMSTNPDVLFGRYSWYTDLPNMDTSIQVLGFWWWWLFIVPSLRSRRPSGAEKRALDWAFLGTPLVSLMSPVFTKDTGIIWTANLVTVAGAYALAFLGVGGEGGDGGGGSGDGEENRPGWLKFVYKSLDFGSGRERGARR